jgi:hypothetical protein
MHVNDLLKAAVERGASDLHLKVGSLPMARIHGNLVPVTDERRLDHEGLVEMVSTVSISMTLRNRRDLSSRTATPTDPHSRSPLARASTRRLGMDIDPTHHRTVFVDHLRNWKTSQLTLNFEL